MMTNGEVSNESRISVYVGLGSNVGDRSANLHDAIERLRKLNLGITKVSSVYETEPVGYSEQPWFLNEVIEAEIRDLVSEVPLAIEAESFLFDLLEIEKAMGRERTFANGPRAIDIDLLLFGAAIIKDSETRITIPHPRMHERRFVLEPLCEIAPDLVHPILKKTCRELLARIDDPSRVRRL